MKTITETELEEILRLHKLWIDGDPSGVRANLTGANLTEADLSGTNLSGANLSNSNLSWANLTEAELTEADLTEANLSWATLSEADLSEADLTEADLTDANLSGVTLHTAIGDGVRIRTTKTERYIINHYDDRCQIGCENYSLSEWAALSDDEIARMDTGALVWWRRWRKFVLTEKEDGEE